MAAHHTKETLGFNNFGGYYASIPEGYGGFDWLEIDHLNASYWQNVTTDWCDTGYQNAIKGTGEAYAWDSYGTFGEFQSPDLHETFSLKSMVAASAWETDQPFDFKTYGRGFVLKASDTVYLSQTAQTIDFAKIGKPGDFNNIVAVTIIPGAGKYGNTRSYGPYGYTLGNVMAFDNMKVVWNGKIQKGDGRLATTGQPMHHQSHTAPAHLVFTNPQHAPALSAQAEAAGHSGAGSGFHTELLSLGEPGSGGLTHDFHLPAIEHFGS